ncbi:hypothetical protein L208DRAFT_1288127 [Tricholoma matsutake]|nr:hypothetical protein L208DRAFT_1288127 [Tricholoma matsutake 945]
MSADRLLDADISVANGKEEFIPSNHQPIFARIVTSNPDQTEATLNTNLSVSLPPHVKYPLKKDKHLFTRYMEETDKLILLWDMANRPVVDDASFLAQYEDLTTILNDTAIAVFGWVHQRT